MNQKYLFGILYQTFRVPLRRISSLKDYYSTLDYVDIKDMQLDVIIETQKEIEWALEHPDYDFNSILETNYTNEELYKWFRIYHAHILFIIDNYNKGIYKIETDDLDRMNPTCNDYEKMNYEVIISIIEKRDFNEIEKNFNSIKQAVNRDKKLLDSLLRNLQFKLTCLEHNFLDPFFAQKFLDLSFHRLKKLPKAVWELRHIERLDCMRGELAVIPEEVQNLTQLVTLYASYNSIEQIPASFGKLNKLEGLWLNNNKLTDLPDELSNLSNLKEVCLDINKLTMMPGFIKHLKKLENLRFVDNQIEEIPEFIFDLENLRNLSIGFNKIRYISPSVGKLRNLRYLGLQGNPIKTLPIEINNLNLNRLALKNTEIRNTDFLQEHLKKALI